MNLQMVSKEGPIGENVYKRVKRPVQLTNNERDLKLPPIQKAPSNLDSQRYRNDVPAKIDFNKTYQSVERRPKQDDQEIQLNLIKVTKDSTAEMHNRMYTRVQPFTCKSCLTSQEVVSTHHSRTKIIRKPAESLISSNCKDCGAFLLAYKHLDGTIEIISQALKQLQFAKFNADCQPAKILKSQKSD